MLSFRDMCVKCLAGIILLLVSGQVAAQSLQEAIAAAQDHYNRTLQQAEDFIKETDKAYAEYMKNPWKKVSLTKVEINPYAEFPKTKPEVFSPGDRSSRLQLLQCDVTHIGGLNADPGRYMKLEYDSYENIEVRDVLVSFNGYDISMRFAEDCEIHIDNTSEEHLASVWMQMSDSPYDLILSDIVKIGKHLVLSDWSIVKYVEAFCDAVYDAPEMHRESVMTQVYLLHRLGFRVCLAHDGYDNLYRLISSDATLNGTKEIYQDGIPYTLIGDYDGIDLSPYFFDDHGEYPVSMAVNRNEHFYSEYSDTLSFVSEKYPEVAVSVPVNVALKKFYEEFPIYHTDGNPLTEFYYRAMAPMSGDIVETVYPVLADALNGKSYLEALNMLLDFVQTAFRYEMDSDRWSKERFFFPGEIWYHDASDCDDKAILFSRLVRDILKLKVALVFWPGHLSCAVNLDGHQEGFMFDVSGEKFVSCDPTMPEACVGDVMEVLKDVKASLILL